MASAHEQAAKPRLDWGSVLPQAREAMTQLESVSHHVGPPAATLELVKIRVSQLNGCAYCLDMHTKDARVRGETEQRLYAVAVWKESPFYSGAERAALAWAEALTHISQGAPDNVYEALHEYYSEQEIVGLTCAIVAINSWNRWAISMRAEPGTYRPDLAR